MIAELKSCPFCRGIDTRPYESPDLPYSNLSTQWCFVCPDCGARGPIARSRDDAAEYWNDRAETAEVKLREAARAAIAYVIAEGPCDDIDDCEESHCGNTSCDYCNLCVAVNQISGSEL